MNEEASSAAVRQVEKSSRWLRAISTIGMAIILVVVVTFGLINTLSQNSAHHTSLREQANLLVILQRVEAVTNPDSAYSKTAAAGEQVVIAKIISCLENHEDRLVTVVDHKVVPAIEAGCPAEGAPLSLLPPTGGK